MNSPTKVPFSLHHVGYAVASIESITGLYRNCFGYEVCSPIIHDPIQTAYVQFLRLPGDHTYLEFVAPDGPNSKLKGAIRKGGGLNHLCYQVDDIDTATAQLQEAGMRVLSQPVPAAAFPGRRIAWLFGEDGLPVELVEKGVPGEL